MINYLFININKLRKSPSYLHIFISIYPPKNLFQPRGWYWYHQIGLEAFWQPISGAMHMIPPLYLPNPQQASVVTFKPESEIRYEMLRVDQQRKREKKIRYLTITFVILNYIHRTFIHITENYFDIRELLTKLLNHVSHDKVELHDMSMSFIFSTHSPFLLLYFHK
jgi:hypothetical protein